MINDYSRVTSTAFLLCNLHAATCYTHDYITVEPRRNENTFLGSFSAKYEICVYFNFITLTE